MAGIRQHIIPKFLQKGFASRIDGDQVFTWVYRIKSKPFEANTNNINLEKHFYGKEGELNADDEITKVEKDKFSPLIDKLRDAKCNFDESKIEIAELIAHLSVRTKLIRKGFELMSEQMIGGIKEVLTDEDTVSNVLLKPNESQIESLFDEVLMDCNSPELKDSLALLQMFGLEKEDVKHLMTNITLSNLNAEESKEKTEGFTIEVFSTVFNELIKSLPNSIKDGHIKSLTEHTIPTPRVEKYKQFDWNIFETESPIILGDVACIFKVAGEDIFKASCEIENTNQIYLPISSNQILIGANNSESPELDVGILNEAIARTSFEQFICCEESDEKASLIKIIGTDAYLASDEEIENELNEIRNNVEKLKENL